MKKSIYTKRGAKLCGWLRTKREEAGLTMRDLGAKLGVNFQFVSKVELGDRRLDVVEYVAYCAEIDADPHEGLKIIEGAKK